MDGIAKRNVATQPLELPSCVRLPGRTWLFSLNVSLLLVAPLGLRLALLSMCDGPPPLWSP